MVRGLGVSHKSLFVPGVSEGTYAIRFEHADYLTKNFNISVGDGLPTTFTEGMTEKAYNMAISTHYALGLLEDNTVMEGDIAHAGFSITNTGNTNIAGHYEVYIDTTRHFWGDTILLSPSQAAGPFLVPIDTAGYTPGNYIVKVEANPSGHGITDTLSATLTISEWTTDITFIATAPGISDLHGVEVFIDGTSMGTT